MHEFLSLSLLSHTHRGHKGIWRERERESMRLLMHAAIVFTHTHTAGRKERWKWPRSLLKGRGLSLAKLLQNTADAKLIGRLFSCHRRPLLPLRLDRRSFTGTFA